MNAFKKYCMKLLDHLNKCVHKRWKKYTKELYYGNREKWTYETIDTGPKVLKQEVWKAMKITKNGKVIGTFSRDKGAGGPSSKDDSDEADERGKATA